jgi:gamma-glutamylputrescine oxidase
MLYGKDKIYDPLLSDNPGHGESYTDTYWKDTAGTAPSDDGPISAMTDCDVAIIGGGYTGMSCAYFLAKEYGIRAIVLEANKPGWGCSGRNGSFARISGGRVPFGELVSRYGASTAKAYFGEMTEGLETVKALIAEGEIDCDAMPDAVFKVASRAEHFEKLKAEVALYNEVAGYPAQVISKAELQSAHGGVEAHGALFMPDGFAMHPLKLVWGIQRLARLQGAKIHSASPVIDWATENGRHFLVTPGGTVRANAVVVATNGYTHPNLNKATARRVHPVYSQILVTEPLQGAQIAATLPSTGCMFDTHNLLHYYRRLPDNRILFGGRSAISGRDVENPRHEASLYEGLVRKFPSIKGIAISHSWGGWVALSRDSLPFAYKVPELPNTWFGGAYAGSGVSFSTLNGKRLAQMVAGHTQPSPAQILHRVPARFPSPAITRMGQKMAYAWLRFKDGSA